MKNSKYCLILVMLFVFDNFAFAQNLAQRKVNKAGKTPKGPTRFKSLNYLYAVSGKYTISGIHNREPNAEPKKWTQEVFNTTGKYPGLWSGDFLFQSENIENRQTMINEAAEQWKKGSIVNIMWHACNPALEQPCGWDKKGVLSKLSDQQWKELLTDGTLINTRWKSMMDEIALYLGQLKEKNVEVLFRPLHEMNQGVFWWGGRPGPEGTRKLYQLTHDYLTKTKKLDNLIWVWDIQDFKTLAQDAVDYNPGEGYWDVAALDIYDDKTGFSQQKYDIMVKAGGKKPIAIGECQVFPTSEMMGKQQKWTFFMGWSELVFSHNTPVQLNALMKAKNIISLDEMNGW